MDKHKEMAPYVKEIGIIEVEVRKLVTVINDYNLPHPDFLFIDVQGAEYMVLSAIPPEILINVSAIYTEASTISVYANAKNLDEIETLLLNTHKLMGFSGLSNNIKIHGNAFFINNKINI